MVEANVDSATFLATDKYLYDIDETMEVVFDGSQPGSSYYLYNDFRCVVTVTDRSDFLWFANSLPEIIKAFEVEEQKVIDELRNGFDALRKVAELHK